jgi:hypothetical protein
LPVFGGMLVEPFTTFIVPTLYCGYMELKMRVGLQDSPRPASNERTAEDGVPAR